MMVAGPVTQPWLYPCGQTTGTSTVKYGSNEHAINENSSVKK